MCFVFKDFRKYYYGRHARFKCLLWTSNLMFFFSLWNLYRKDKKHCMLMMIMCGPLSSSHEFNFIDLFFFISGYLTLSWSILLSNHPIDIISNWETYAFSFKQNNKLTLMFPSYSAQFTYLVKSMTHIGQPNLCTKFYSMHKRWQLQFNIFFLFAH